MAPGSDGGPPAEAQGLLAGKVALVSGVGPGTGRAIALALAGAGADVALVSRQASHHAPLADEVRRLGRRALGILADITDAAQRQHVVEAVCSGLGRIDVLVNNAFALGPMAPLQTMDVEKAWRAPFKVNLFATVAMTLATLPALRAAGGGSVVMVASLAGRRPEPGLAAYGASKAALLHAVRSLAMELGPDRIRVNAVVPSHIDGPALRAWFRMQAASRGVSEEEIHAETAALGALQRVTTADEVAAVVTFFASPMSSAVTGQTLDVNSGQWFE